MSDQIPMRSASERRDAAKAVVTEYEGRLAKLGPSIETTYERALYSALTPLLEVPEVGITEDEIVTEEMHWLKVNSRLALIELLPSVTALIEDAMRKAVQAAERAALEHWEPADVPSQEFMLRHLGIIHRPIPENGRIGIPAQYIAKGD